MNTEEKNLLLDLMKLVAKYSIVSKREELYDEYSHRILKDKLQIDDSDFLNQKNIFKLLGVDSNGMGSNYGKHISKQDDEQLRIICKKISSIFPQESQIFILLLIVQNLNFNEKNKEHTIEILYGINHLLKVAEYAIENILSLLKLDNKKIFNFPLIIAQFNELELIDQVEGNNHLKINNPDLRIEFIRASNSAFFAFHDSNIKVYNNIVLIHPNYVCHFDQHTSFDFEHDKISFKKLEKSDKKRHGLPLIHIDATETTPKIEFDASKHVFEISGKSVPTDTLAFYNPLLRWLDKYSKSKPNEVTMVFELDYFGTSSSKFILEILRKLEQMHQNGSKVNVKWFYSEYDDDLKEAGENFSEIIDVPFQIMINNLHH